MYTAWDTPDTDYCLCCGSSCQLYCGSNEIVIKGKAVRLCDVCFGAMQSTDIGLQSRVVSRLIHYSVNVNC